MQMGVEPYTAEPARAVSALLHLLSRFPARQSPAIAQAIVAHLRLVGDDPQIAGCIRESAADLVAEWEAYAVLSELEASGNSTRCC
ncbi:hypothetical protein GO613_11410 [Azoarcus communis]|uniref:Uncharacterized protein n=2 Tax=Parazoarcus communis TaxID=41977 RepID=A0A323V1R1_9RHOO|nr:hypothetical protein [Parazoarcus communis]NMG69123.1 hypothetical protein [Parazoarcus communis SWub3 = DSM 12120]PZA18677.1 hypothetical protein DNK49_02250 [Azoarcus communis] [Parazoarcus communis SWub3 = DSM 12120]